MVHSLVPVWLWPYEVGFNHAFVSDLSGLVELQYVSPQSAGLFQGAISESGGANPACIPCLRNTAEKLPPSPVML